MFKQLIYPETTPAISVFVLSRGEKKLDICIVSKKKRNNTTIIKNAYAIIGIIPRIKSNDIYNLMSHFRISKEISVGM